MSTQRVTVGTVERCMCTWSLIKDSMKVKSQTKLVVSYSFFLESAIKHTSDCKWPPKTAELIEQLTT
jgi:hypothetical protein